MSLFSSVGSACSSVCSLAARGIKGGWEALKWVDDKTVKVWSSIEHMVESRQARNTSEFLLAGLTCLRGCSNIVVGAAYAQLLAAGASVSDVFNGDVSLTTATVAFAAIGLIANGFLESASAIKSWALKSQGLNENSLAVERIMNKKFLEAIARLNLNPADQRHIQGIFTKQALTSLGFALGFATLGVLSLGRFISPQGILIGVTAPIFLKMGRYIYFNSKLEKALEEAAEAATKKRDRAAEMFDDGGSAAAVGSSQSKLHRSPTSLAASQQLSHSSMQQQLTVSAQQKSLKDVAASIVIVDVADPIGVPRGHENSFNDDQSSNDADDMLSFDDGVVVSYPSSSAADGGDSSSSAADGVDHRAPNGSPVLSDDSSDAALRRNAYSPVMSDVSEAARQPSLHDIEAAYGSDAALQRSAHSPVLSDVSEAPRQPSLHGIEAAYSQEDDHSSQAS